MWFPEYTLSEKSLLLQIIANSKQNRSLFQTETDPVFNVNKNTYFLLMAAGFWDYSVPNVPTATHMNNNNSDLTQQEGSGKKTANLV